MDINQAIKDYQPLVKKTVHKYRASGIPPSLLRLEAEMIVADSARQCDSEKTFPAFVKGNMMKMHRIVNDASEMYIPEYRANRLGEYERQIDELSTSLKRSPSVEEMADQMKVSNKEIERLSQETRKRLVHMDMMPEISSVMMMPKKDESRVLEMVYDRSPKNKEKSILEHTFGLHGKSLIKTDKEMADELGMSQTAVRNAKDKLIDLIGEVY